MNEEINEGFLGPENSPDLIFNNKNDKNKEEILVRENSHDLNFNMSLFSI